MIKLLQNNICEVQFKKKDDSIRTMRCTLDPTVLIKVDENFNESYSGTVDLDCDHIRVFDLEANGWRSFNRSQVIQIKL